MKKSYYNSVLTITISAFFVSAKQDLPMKLVEMNPIPIPNCDGPTNKSGCMQLVSSMSASM